MYNEPPEWSGRGPRDRQGWPNSTYEPDGPPRSHREPGGDRRRQYEEGDTGEQRPARGLYDPDMPTDPIMRTRVGGPGRRIIRPSFVLARETDPLVRLNLWLSLGCKVIGLVALLLAIWVFGMVAARGGVPLWVPRSA